MGASIEDGKLSDKEDVHDWSGKSKIISREDEANEDDYEEDSYQESEQSQNLRDELLKSQQPENDDQVSEEIVEEADLDMSYEDRFD